MFKTRLDTFRNDFDHFWNFAKFLIFWNHFEDSTLHGTLRKKNFRKKTPKRVQNTFWRFGNDFGRCLIFENFFKTFRRLDPPWNTGQKKFFEKITPKHVQNTFWHFWDRFWAFLEFCKFFDFLKPFQRLDPPWNTGQKTFSKKLPQNMFKTCLDKLGTILGVFSILKFF